MSSGDIWRLLRDLPACFPVFFVMLFLLDSYLNEIALLNGLEEQKKRLYTLLHESVTFQKLQHRDDAHLWFFDLEKMGCIGHKVVFKTGESGEIHTRQE